MGGPPPGTQEASVSASDSPYLVEVFRGCPHFLPCLVQELDTDAEKLLEGSVVGEEHRVEIVAGLTSWRKEGRKCEKGNERIQTHAPKGDDERHIWLKPQWKKRHFEKATKG